MKLSRGLKNQILAASLGAVMGGFTLSQLKGADDAKASQIIAEQKALIRKLTAENKSLLAGAGGTGEGEATAESDSANACVEQLNTCERNAYFTASVFCQFAQDPVDLAKKRRNNCDDAMKLNVFIDRAIERCDTAIAYEKAPEILKTLKKAKTNLFDSKSHYRISPPQCAEIIQPKSND